MPLKSTGRTLVNAQQLRLSEAPGLGLVMTARKGKAKVAARVATSPDHLAGAVGQVPSLEREHDTGVEYLASPRSEEVPNGVSVSEIVGMFLFVDLQSHGASWIMRCAWRSRHVAWSRLV